MEKHTHIDMHSEPRAKKHSDEEVHNKSEDVASLAEIGANIKKWSKTHPVEAALIGAGVGFLLGVALRKTFTRSE